MQYINFMKTCRYLGEEYTICISSYCGGCYRYWISIRVEYLYRYRTGRYFLNFYRTGTGPVQAEPRVPYLRYLENSVSLVKTYVTLLG